MDTQKPSKTTKPEEQQTSAAAEESSANMENSMPLLYTDHIDSFIFDIPSSDDYIYGLNFSLLDSIQPPLTPLDPPSEAVNTPNSTSFSESSSEGVNDEQRVKEKEEEQEQEQEQDKCKQLLKVKKKKEKRKREARVAFMTKSDVEHLDDGYRWRKYGQKAVKNSPFPRSYYRCTTAACGVKKRVERSSEDPSIVVTTYEGQHTHPCPLISRGSLGLTGHSPTSSLLLPSPQHHHHHHFLYHPQQQQQCLPPSSHNPTPSLSFTTNNLSFSSTNFFHQKRYSASQESMLRDHGLLQDIVPSQIQKDHQEQPQEEKH